jgi:tetratricopeptide (TPR) repeat protein
MPANRTRVAKAPRPAAAPRADAAHASLIAQGLEHHRRGELDAARAAYTRVLAAEPGHFDALHLLGVVAAQIGQPELAVRMIALALQVRPESPEALNSLAQALIALGKPDAAEEALRQALALAPAYTDALMNLGGLLLDLERNSEALHVLSQARRVAPRNAGILNNLGNAWRKLDCPQEAEQAFRAVLRESPFHLQAMLNLGHLLLEREGVDEALALLQEAARNAPRSGAAQRLLGEAYERAGLSDLACACYRHALALDPGDGLACSRLGMAALNAGDAARGLGYLRHAAEISPSDPDVLANLARGALAADALDEGGAAALEALRRNPRHTGALVNLAAIERHRGRFDAAERLCRDALAIAPGLRTARLNLTIALLEMGRHEEAERILDAMVAADYGDVEAHWNRAIARLARGALKCGWAEFDWRWRLPQVSAPRVPPVPEWNNAPLRGRKLWLWPEQGLADQLVFLSLLPDLTARQAELVVECDPRLVALLQRSFAGARFMPAGEASAAEAAACDYQLSLGSLARHLRADIAAFPKRGGYLAAHAEEKLRWRAWLNGCGGGRKVGISWRSHNLAGERSLACARLEQWLPVLRCADVQLICLQYDDCAAELADIAQRHGIAVHQPPGLDQRNDLDGVCGLVSALDLVITAPTTVSALAGALGVPTWQLNSGIDWHGLNQPYSPWQPSVRRFYKPWDRSWDEELARVAADLQRMCAPKAAS